MPASEPTGSVAIGRYLLEVGSPAGTLLSPHAAAADHTPLADALESEPSQRLTVVEATERVVTRTSEMTQHAEEAVDLFRASVEGSLLTPEQLSGRLEVMLDLLQRLDREGHWEEALRVARLINGFLTLGMRWADLVRSLGIARQAAERLGDSSATAWAQHELGTLRLVANDAVGAEQRLAEAHERRRQLSEHDGLAATERNLSVLCRHLRELLREGRLEPRRDGARRLVPALAAAVLLLFGAGVLGAVIDPFDAGPDPRLSPVDRAQLTMRVQGPGTVSSRPAGISCPKRCKRDFARRSQIVLRAKPAGGATFAGWTGACEGTDPCHLLLRQDATAVAAFRNKPPPARATLRLRTFSNGRVTSSPAGIDCRNGCTTLFPRGQSVTLTAQPDEGYGLNRWRGDCEGSGQCTLTMDADRTVSPDFRPQRTITVTVDLAPGTTGTVTSDPPGIECTVGTCSAPFLATDNTVALTATGDFTAVRWGGDCAGQKSPTCSLALDADHTVTVRLRKFS